MTVLPGKMAAQSVKAFAVKPESLSLTDLQDT